MNLATLRNYFEACSVAERQLQENWLKLSKLPSYCLFRLISTQSQPKIDASLIRQFVVSFNWQALLPLANQAQDQAKYRIYSMRAQMNEDELLDYGLELLVNYWGTSQALTFDQFSTLIKGTVELPVKNGEVPFPNKKMLFESLMNEMKNLIKLEDTKRIVYYEYKNLADLFETVTAQRCIEYENVQRLFLSFSERKTDDDLQRLCKRARIPWDFQCFLKTFKRSCENKPTEFKIYHSARRNKNQQDVDKAFTTPRKEKFAYNQSSTKLTKAQNIEQEQKPRPRRFLSEGEPQIKDHHIYVSVLADLLAIEEEFIKKCTQLVQRKDFDLELVYEKAGKKFEQILNARYGVCNFSSFVRFIVPRDYQHRYLSFIRYQSNDLLSKDTSRMIDDLLQSYQEKQMEIQQIWKRCDKEMLLRHFCHPSQDKIRNEKLREIFTSREMKILLERLDPHQVGGIELQALN